MRSVSVVYVCAALCLTWPGQAKAFQETVTKRQQYMNGPARVAIVTGTYRLAPFEQLVGVYIVGQDAQGATISTAQGVFNPATGAWSAGEGDFALATYKILFKVQYGTNRVPRNYYSPTFRWLGSSR